MTTTKNETPVKLTEEQLARLDTYVCMYDPRVRGEALSAVERAVPIVRRMKSLKDMVLDGDPLDEDGGRIFTEVTGIQLPWM
jgi:hypothetical protein